jgi:hypothetical protein
MNEGHPHGRGEFLLRGNEVKLLEALEFCLSDGAITPGEIGRVLRALPESDGNERGCVALARQSAEGARGGDPEQMFLLHKAVFAILRKGSQPKGSNVESGANSRYGGPAWIRTPLGDWGPVGWMLIRGWLRAELLSPETLVSLDERQSWQRAGDVKKFQSTPKGLKSRLDWVASKTESLPPTLVTRALASRLAELGWPGGILRIRHYYVGNRLREELERNIPDPQRKPFDDAEWPSWMQWPTPMEMEREEELRRGQAATCRQLGVLDFFLGPGHGLTTFGEAHDKISELFEDEERKQRWETRNDHKPATEPQLQRMAWWAAEMKLALPDNPTFGDAKRLLTMWSEQRPDLESKWDTHINEQRIVEMVFGFMASCILDQCDSRGIPRPGEELLRRCWDQAGGWGGEGLDWLLDKITPELAKADARYAALT